MSALIRGKRSMLLHSIAMLHQPQLTPMGKRQAIEIEKKRREVNKIKHSLEMVFFRYYTTNTTPNFTLIVILEIDNE